MTLRVTLATGSGFLSIVIRQTLGRMRHLDLIREDRDAGATVRTLGMQPALTIIDADLLTDGADGEALCKLLAARQAPSILIDARGRGIAAGLAAQSTIHVVRGRQAGELDIGMIEADLRAAIEEVRRRSRAPGAPAAVPPQAAPERVAAYRGVLDLIVIGVSTGGPTLLMRLLKGLERPQIPLLIVQHMPETETAGFAARLAEDSGHAVVELAGGALPAAGTIGVVRGGRDFRLLRSRAGVLQLRAAEVAGNPFHPSVDEILRSAVVAEVMLGAAILTGMGQDGAAGARLMALQGLPVIAQRPDTCVVAGMPQSVIDCGAASAVHSPDGIISSLNAWSALAARQVRVVGVA